MKACFLDTDTVHPEDLDMQPLGQACSQLRTYPFTDSSEQAKRIGDCEVIITNKQKINADSIKDAANVKLICLTATGTDNVDLNAMKKAGITVCNVTGYATESVVQHVFALILNLSIKLDKYRSEVNAGLWSSSRHFSSLTHTIPELSSLTIGIIGYGELGRAVANKAKTFGMKVLVSQRPGGEPQAGRVSLDQVYEQSDIISLHVPLSENTRRLIDETALQKMRPHTILINTARGGVVDNAALARALSKGWIGGAGIDVLEQEPPPTDHPLLQPDIPNLFLTPHIAWASKQSRQRVIDETALNILAFIDGNPRNCV